MTTLLRDVADRATLDDKTYRSYEFDDFEFRDDGPTGFTFEGTASVVDKPYEVRDALGTYNEVIAPGAFNKTLRDGGSYVGLYMNHNHRWGGAPLATRGAGTLKITADPHLRVSANLDPSRPDVQIIASAVKRGEMRQMSIGFNPVKTRDVWTDDFSQVTRNEVKLFEASIVELGASQMTSGSMRSFDAFMESLTDIDMTEDELRRAIAAFELRLPVPEVDETPEINTFELRDLYETERLARRRKALEATFALVA